MHSKFIFLTLLIMALSGCSALVSPYSSTFQCPETNKGKCVSVQTAYKESVDNPLVKADPNSPPRKAVKNDKPPCETCGEKEENKEEYPSETTPGVSASTDTKYRYQDALFMKLASLIRQPATPVVVPPDVVRVLILSYTGSDNELFSYRYVYFFATDPKWVISTGKEVDRYERRHHLDDRWLWPCHRHIGFEVQEGQERKGELTSTAGPEYGIASER